MTERERSTPLVAGLFETAAGVWLLAGAAAVAVAIDAPIWVRAGCVVVGAVLGTVVCVAGARRRVARVGRVEAAARGLLRADLEELEGGEARARVRSAGVGSEGEFAGLMGALDDLAERIEGQIKEAAKKGRNLEALIDAIDEPLLATDDENRVLLCNRSAETLFDAAPGGLVGRPMGELFTSREILEMHAAARSGEVRRGRVRLTTALGTRVLQVSASPVPAAWGEGVFGAVVFLRDVTELDQAVQVKTDFVANASHELRTPVSAIKGAAETLLDGAKDDAVMGPKLLKMILTHASRLEEMLRDLLDLSRLESPEVPVQVGAVDVGEVEGALRGMFEHACREKELRLEFDFEEELAGLRTDRKLLLLMLRNLIENATKFAYAGTVVKVSGSAVEMNVPDARAPGDGAAPALLRGVARFEVKDRGVGIPLSQQERVFERYYQVDQARSGPAAKRGTGLGLSIVKHAARALGGSVGLSSVYKEGTSVWVELPCEFERGASGEGRSAGAAA